MPIEPQKKLLAISLTIWQLRSFLALMLIVMPKRGRKKGGKVQFPGLMADARALERSPGHLWRVLTGQRTGKSLLRRYQELKQTHSTP
jgi:hypothetical protein